MIAGIDGTPEALQQIEAGNLDVTVFHNAAGQADKAAAVAKQLMKGETEEQETWLPFELVTPRP